MSKRKMLNWKFIVPGLILGAALVHADPVDIHVEKDLLSSNLNQPSDPEQKDFRGYTYKGQVYKVEQVPSPLSDIEKQALLSPGRRLWNRDWLDQRIKTNTVPSDIPLTAKQKANEDGFVASAIVAYNKVVDDILSQRKRDGHAKTVGANESASKAENIAAPPAVCTQTSAPPVPEAVKNLVKAADPALDAAVTAQQNTDEAQAEREDSQDPASKLPPHAVDNAAKTRYRATSAPQKIALPENGFLSAIQHDPSNSNTLYAMEVDMSAQHGTPYNKSYLVRSDDGGATWTEVNKFVDTDINNPLSSTVAISSGGKDIFVNTNEGVLHSVDGGQTFMTLPGGLGKATDVKLSSDGKELIVAYDLGKGIQTYTQNGGSWAPSQSQPDDLIKWVNQQYNSDPACSEDGAGKCPYDVGNNLKTFSVQADANNPDIIYAGLGAGLYRYEKGQGWSIINGIHSDSLVSNIETNKSGVVTISTCNGIYTGNLSQPDGTPTPNAQAEVTKLPGNSFVDQRTGQITPHYLRAYNVDVDPNNSKNIVAASASGIYVSHDAGRSWNRIAGGAMTDLASNGIYAEYRSATWLPDGSVVASGSSGTYKFTP